MTRQTSIDCYNQIKAEGLLGRSSMEVYEGVYKYGPVTAGELAQELTGIPRNDISSRLTQLRKKGVVSEVQCRNCKVSGRNVIEWEVTDRLPVKPIKTKTAKELRTDEALEALREVYLDRDNERKWLNAAVLIKVI